MGEKSSIYLAQLKAMLLRNILLKKRETRRTTAEVLIPCLFLGLVYMLKVGMPTLHHPEIRTPRGDAKLFENFQQYRNHTVAIVPNTSDTQNFLDAVNDMWQSMHLDPGNQPINFVLYESEDELLKAYWNNPSSIPIAVIFDNDDPIRYGLSYAIRTNPLFVSTPRTDILIADPTYCRGSYNHWSGMFPLEMGDLCPVNQYYYSGFVAIQALLDYTKIKLDAKQDDIEVPEVILELLPKAAHTAAVLRYIQMISPFYLMIAFSQFINYLMILIVGEKEKKIKEGMKIMGLKDSIFWISWFIIYGVFMFIISVVGIGLFAALQMFQHSNLLLIFFLIYLYSLTIIMLAFMLTPFFNKSRTAGVFASVPIYVMGVLYFLKLYMTEFPPFILWLTTLLSATGFAIGMEQALILEMQGNGLRLDNMWSGSPVPFGGCLVMMAVDILLYGFMAYYLDSVIPSEHGVKSKPWFCFTHDYWCEKKSVMHQIPTANGESGSFNADQENNVNIEPVSREMRGKEAIKIVNLHKTFKKFLRSKKVTAVDGIDLTIYEGQITAILGHNAAGKTTIFNMLTGLTAPTSGTALIFGYDIRNFNDMTAIQRMIGVCPQHDILFDVLTPREHLEFYACVKGVPASLVDFEVARTLTDIDLTDKANTYAKNLSGGQKRKLSVGIALIGDPKIIILDEPTAGVDPYSRRHMWSLLQNKKHGKVILLTTHFMDEADILADRKAIISKGRLRCCGSSLFLKNKFGIGYHLTLVLGNNVREQAIQRLVTSHIAQAEKARCHGRELSFILPRNGVDSFPTLFQAIEQEISHGRLGITSYGVSMTTLEEVFLQLEPDEEEGDVTDDDTIENISKKMVRNRALSRSLSLQSKSTSYQSLQNEGGVQAAGVTVDGQARGDIPANPIQNDTSLTENPVSGLAFDQIQLNPNVVQTLVALLRIRLLRVFRDLPKHLLYIILPSLCSIVISLPMQRTVEKMPSLDLNVDTYLMRRVAMHNASVSRIDDLLLAMREGGVSDVTHYNGNFSLLLDIAPHMLAYNINVYDIPELSVTTMYNDTFQHSLPIAMNIISNAYYRLVMDTRPVSTIKVRTHPFERTSNIESPSISTIISGIVLGLAIVIIPSTLTPELVYDREIKAKNQLRVNGLSFCSYFISYFVVMCLIIYLSYFGIIITVTVTNSPPSLSEVPARVILIAFFFFFTIDAVLFFSCWTYLFKKTETAQSFMPNCFYPSGMVCFGIVVLLNLLVKSGNASVYIHSVLSFLWPPYIPFAMVYYLDIVYQLCLLNNACEELTLYNYMTNEIIVIMAATIVHIPFFFLLLLIIDIKHAGGRVSDIYKHLLHRTDTEDVVENSDVSELEDDDVKAERRKVAQILSSNLRDPPVVVVQNLRKEYHEPGDTCCNSACCASKEEDGNNARTNVVVRNISMAVDAGEVFGLLGHNGAGKTTTMKIIIAEEAASRGRVQIGGHFITSNIAAAFKVLGYCPQHDAQWKDITIREHLECYASIRGVPPGDITRLVDTYLMGLQILEHSDKESQQCSGGTRRKLSFSMAMAGDPRIVLLDEPSTGMDPRSKRFLWDTILASFQGTRGAILTTHSMEEADALCSRVAIMVKGSLRCVGSTQHLKNKYGAGYTLEMKLRGGDRTPTTPSSHHSKDLKELVRRLFKDSVLDESFADRLVFSVPQSSVTSLAHCFKQLEKVKADLDIEDYSFSQTTLEQVFLKFAHYDKMDDN